MAEENNNLEQTETTEPNYIQVIADLKANSVSREQYNKVLKENKQLTDTLISGGQLQQANESGPSEQELIDALSNGSLSDLQTIECSLALRDIALARGEKDPYLPNNPDYIPTEADIKLYDNMAKTLKEICEYANGDNRVFEAEYKRRSSQGNMFNSGSLFNRR